MKTPLFATIACGLTLAASAPVCADQGPRPGLEVRDGRFFLDGRPYRGVGANYFDVFLRLLLKNDDSGLDRMKRLSEAGIPFIRFIAGPFQPRDWKLYRENEEEYFRRLDRVIRTAEECGVGLIPSLAWTSFAVPDAVGEPMGAWGNPSSATWQFFRDYVRKVVARYRYSPALWAWEFGNEYNLAVDLPNAKEHRGPTHVNLGNPATRSQADELTSQDVDTALREFAKTVRETDKYRPLLSGHSKPRPSAWHQRQERSWKQDNREQFSEMLLAENPEELGVISVHYYEGADGSKAGGAWAANRADYLRETVRVARTRKAPVWVGEFGVESDENLEKMRRDFAALLADMESAGVDLAAFWVFDLPSQENTWDVTFTNDRSFMIEMAAKANAKWQQAAGSGVAQNAPSIGDQ